MKTFILFTPYDCLVKTKEKEIFLSPNETLEIEGKALIYPLCSSHERLPFSLSTEHLEPNNFYDFDNKFIILRSESCCENFNISTINVGGETITFEIGSKKINILTKKLKRTIYLEKPYEDYKISSKFNIAYILLSCKSQSCLYALNVKTNKIKKFSGNSITINENGFSVKKSLANETINKDYIISSQGLSQKKKEDTFIVPSCDEVTAYYFLDAIKTENYDGALELCAANIKAKLSSESIKSFLGKILNFFCITPYHYVVQNKQGILNLKFEVKNKKVVDIET